MISLNHYASPIPHVHPPAGGGAAGRAGRLRRQWSTAPSASAPIAIGYELPLTGTVALPGKQEQEGWNLGLKEFGQTVAGHRIVTYFEDTGGNPAVALSDARSLAGPGSGCQGGRRCCRAGQSPRSMGRRDGELSYYDDWRQPTVGHDCHARALTGMIAARGVRWRGGCAGWEQEAGRRDPGPHHGASGPRR
jgi:hypothetical protein